MPTGKCINSTFMNKTKVCEVKGWCPMENNSERLFYLKHISTSISLYLE